MLLLARHVRQDVTAAIVRLVILDNLGQETTKTVRFVTVVQQVGIKMLEVKVRVCRVFRVFTQVVKAVTSALNVQKESLQQVLHRHRAGHPKTVSLLDPPKQEK